jgi:hypothetical protein
MFKDEFYYRPKLCSLFFKSPCMKFEGDGDADDGGDGSGSGSEETHWIDEKYPSLVQHKSILGRYKTEEDAHKAHLEARKSISAPYRLPKALDGLNDEQKKEFESSIAKLRGIPDTPDGYKITKPEDVPEGIIFTEEDDKAARELARKHNASNETLQAFYDFQYEMVRKAHEAKAKANEKAAEECVKQLKDLWKGDYNENSVLIERYLRSMVNPNWTTISDDKDEKWQKFRTAIYDSQVGNNPIIMQAILSSAKQAVSEGKTLPGVTKKGEKAPTTAEEQWKKEYPDSPYPGKTGG